MSKLWLMLVVAFVATLPRLEAQQAARKAHPAPAGRADDEEAIKSLLASESATSRTPSSGTSKS